MWLYDLLWWFIIHDTNVLHRYLLCISSVKSVFDTDYDNTCYSFWNELNRSQFISQGDVSSDTATPPENDPRIETQIKQE